MDNHKVVWTEGMFLSPQHFQQQSRYTENFSREYAEQISPQLFGLTQLELDMSMLTSGKVAVRRAKGIFLDGTPFEVNQSIVLEIPKNTNNKKVYLSLPVIRSGAVDVGEGGRHRYSVVQHSVYDTSRENSDAVELDLAELNIGLKLEGDDLQDFTLITVAEISAHKPESGVVLNQAFVPQSLQFGVSQYLREGLSDVFSQVQYRAKTISARLKAENNRKSDQALMRDFLWLQALGMWMPKLEQWLQDGTLLTRALYLECVSMAGQMLGLEGKMPQSFPVWNPNGLYHIFSTVYSELLVALREVQIDSVVTLQWDTQLFLSRRLLRTLVPDRSLYQQSRFILVVTSNIATTQLSEQFPRVTKLAGNSDIARLVRNSLSGVPLNPLPYAPSELKAHSAATYFELDVQCDLWRGLIKKDEPIALHVDDCLEDINVEFHVIR
ncbi:type VI secretion system baseplate subunit TssK [Vibrio sp. S4M6]|uniref:type VI secretion system baseplate subunit TssK n=1 Tax=Vibrio sinus TaxID=2946865 RepID=UPI00202A6894|nr:type VI secretion system baseplate subunit TssK [Vibrio sinus]MCL9781231.1 type VI secretion system baseplate subunit TssK [Vibrio sinus]